MYLRLFLTLCLIATGAALFFATRRNEPLAAPGEEQRYVVLSTRTVWSGLALLAVFAVVTLGFKLHARPPDLKWSRYGYLDKRWTLIAFWSGVLGVMLLPTFLELVVRGAPPPAGPAPTAGTAGRRRRGPILARAALGVALATAAFGPPWNAGALAWPPADEELVHWTGLQAIDRGYTPYLGPASVNYGPGLQLWTYGYMKLGDFTIPGFRESFAASLWLSLSVVLAIQFSVLALVPALFAAFSALLVSPVLLWDWRSDGVLTGMFGWANPLRTIGPFVLAMALFAHVTRDRTARRLVPGAVGIGALWGLLAYFAQENLLGGFLTLGILALLLCTTGTIDARSFRHLCLALAGGFACVWLPALVFYLSRGALGEFWHNYSLVPARFLRGYGNTSFDPHSDIAVAYYALPYVLSLLAALVLYRLRPLGAVAGLDRDRLLMVSACCAQVATLPPAMLRADPMHLAAALLPLPLVVAVALFHLPRVLTRSDGRRWIVRSVVVLVAATVFLPTLLSSGDRLQRLFLGRVRSFTADIPDLPRGADVVATRMGPALLQREPWKADLLRQVRDAIGGRPCYAALRHAGKDLSAAYVYFVGDLVPGPLLMEHTDLVADDRMVRSFRRHLHENVDRFEAVLTLKPDALELAPFRASAPGYSTRILHGPDLELYVLTR